MMLSTEPRKKCLIKYKCMTARKKGEQDMPGYARIVRDARVQLNKTKGCGGGSCVRGVNQFKASKDVDVLPLAQRKLCKIMPQKQPRRCFQGGDAAAVSHQHLCLKA